MNFKLRMLSIISFLMILGFSITAFSSFNIARQQAMSALIDQELPLTLDNVYSEVQKDLLMPQLVSSLMANDTFVQDWVAAGELESDSIARYLTRLKAQYGLFSAFFVSEKTKRYFYPDGVLKTISESSALDNWYYRFRNEANESEINLDPDLSNSNQMTIFINVKVRDQQGALIGITGVGLNINNVEAQLDAYYQKYGKDVYFVNKQGEIILSSRFHYKPKSLQDKAGVRELSKQILAVKEGQFNYQYQHTQYVLTTRYVEELGLFLCVEASTQGITTSLLKPLIINITISLLLLLTIVYLIVKMINRYQRQLEKLAWWDTLTGLFNRVSFSAQYQLEESRHRRYKREMVLVMIDIDFFKQVNDSKGHQQGDKALLRCAEVFKETLRPTDILARWGGEEFILLLPETNLDEAIKTAERLRSSIEIDAALHSLTDTGLTISLGLCVFDENKNIDWHVGRADNCLYKAKDKGRNCVVY